MASLQDIRRRINSVKNTRKITKALELVAGARLRRAQTRIEQMRDYADRMQELMIGTARAASSFRNLALMQRREVSRVALLLVTGDRDYLLRFRMEGLSRHPLRKRNGWWFFRSLSAGPATVRSN